MTHIIPFDFETHAVRVIMVDGSPWFVAVDACRGVEIVNSRHALSRLDDDEKGVAKGDTLGGEQEMNIVSLSGLFALILRSNKPAAKRFRKWITSVVLPALLRDGTYTLPGADGHDLPAKRAFYAGLSDPHRDRADGRAKALAEVEALTANGWRVDAACQHVAEAMGLSKRTVYNWRLAVYMVPKQDWSAAMAPKWSQPQGMEVACHPEGLQFFLTLASCPARVTDCYARYVAEAQANSWFPILPLYTLRRLLKRASTPAGRLDRNTLTSSEGIQRLGALA